MDELVSLGVRLLTGRRVALYPYNKMTHAFDRFRSLIPSVRVEGVIDFTFEHRDCAFSLDVTSDSSLLERTEALLLLDHDLGFAGHDELYVARGVKELFWSMMRRARELDVEVFSLIEPEPETVGRLEREGLSMRVLRHYESAAALYHGPRVERVRRVGVAGTRTCVGKFTATVALNRALRRLGVRSGTLMTEQTGYFFGDRALSNERLDRRQVLDSMLHELRELEVVLAPGQAGVLCEDLPWSTGSLSLFFAELRPHDVLLVTSMADSDAYLRRTVDFCRAMAAGRAPLALLLPAGGQLKYQRFDRYALGDVEREAARRQAMLDLPTFAVGPRDEGIDAAAVYLADQFARADRAS